MLKGAPLCIVACSDPMRSRDYWVEDCAIAVENMLLAARAEGLAPVGSPFIRRTV
jgi:nitroreductase